MTTPFNASVFQEELLADVLRMTKDEDYINLGQLTNFLDYFQYKNPQYDLQALTTLLEDGSFRASLRLLLIYHTLALSLHDKKVYQAAIDVFPAGLAPGEHATTLIDILQHMIDEPMDIQPELEQALSDNPTLRIEVIRAILQEQFRNIL